MPFSKAGKAKRLEREAKAWELRQQGRSIRSIATELAVHPGTVSRCLARVEERVLKRVTEESRLKKVEADAILDEIRDEAIQAWHRSKKPSQHVVKMTTPTGRERTITTVEQRDGDPRFLQTALEATHQLCLLWGLYPARKVEVEADVSLSVSAVTKRLKANMEAFEDDQGRLDGPGQDPPGAT